MKFALRVLPEVLITIAATVLVSAYISLLVTLGDHKFMDAFPSVLGGGFLLALLVWGVIGTKWVVENRDEWIAAIDARAERRLAESQREERELDEMLRREKVIP